MRAHITWIAVMDLACLLVGSAIGVALRFGWEETQQYVFLHVDGWLLLFGGILLANYLAGSYRLQYTFSRFNLVVTWFFSLLFAGFILSITSYAWFNILLGRGVLFLSLAFYSAFSLLLKMLAYRSLFRHEAFVCRTVVLGVDDQALEVRRILENPFVLPAHKVVAYLRTERPKPGEADNPPSVLDGAVVVDATRGRVEDIVRSLGASLIVAESGPRGGLSRFARELRRLRFEGIEVLSPMNVVEIYSGRTDLRMVDEDWIMESSLESGLPLVKGAKRAFDLVASLFAIAALLPLGCLLAGLIKLTSPSAPVFYTQERVGQFGRIFRIVKFRTMVVGAEAATGPVWAADDDPRVTAVGRVLRRFRLDELPQFFNVFGGDMSLVGPRPERPGIAAELAQRIPFYEDRHLLVPGLTGWAQIQYPYGNTVEDTKRKLEYDLYYMKHLSLSLDLQIVLRTLRIVILGLERRA